MPREILNTLTNSPQFVRAGPPHAQLFALRPNVSFRVSDTAVAGHIEQLLARNGPMTIDQFVASADFPGHDILKKALEAHSDEFAWLPDGRVWFAHAPVPVRAAFPGLAQALEFAFSVFPGGATVEDLRRLLCLSACDGGPVTRLAIAKEVGSRPDLYCQISRGTYVLAAAVEGRLIEPGAGRSRASSMFTRKSLPIVFCEEDDDDQKPFNAESFFGGSFTFSAD
jgi:hypothetical protein